MDDQPLDPGVSDSLLEELIRLKADLVQSLDLSLFEGRNDNARRGRRNSFANRIRNGANAMSPPPDWMLPSATVDALAAELSLLRGLIPS